MNKWLVLTIAITILQCDDARHDTALLGKNILSIIPEFLHMQTNPATRAGTTDPGTDAGDTTTDSSRGMQLETSVPDGLELDIPYGPTPPPPSSLPARPQEGATEQPVLYASLARDLAVYPMPLQGADHELQFNVSWTTPEGNPVYDYSLEVSSYTETIDCRTPICYEYNIPGDRQWWLVPAFSHHVAETCAVRPGCAYRVRLITHPWDGHTAANINVELDECVAGVCSCAHAPRLPAPQVSATTVSVLGELFVNVTWTLPTPLFPQRLPPDLMKQAYFVSIGKQMVSDAHPSPWFAHTVSRRVDADGLVSIGDTTRSLLLPVVENNQQPMERKDKSMQGLVLDVKLLARVSLIDDRACIGPSGNATAYDPKADARKMGMKPIIIWASMGGVCVLAMFGIFFMSARAIKRLLHALRPMPVSVPLEPLRRKPVWFPLKFRGNGEVSKHGQVENSPLYVHKEYENEEELGDEFEVNRSRVHLGSLIGSGAFGRVHVAQLDLPGGETLTVAAKMLTEDATEDEMQDFLREIAMLKHVGNHKHVIRLVACCTRRAPLLALLEHAPRGDLLTLLRAARGRRKDTQGSNVTRRVDSDLNARPSEQNSQYTNLSDSDPTLTDCKLYLDGDRQRNDHYVAEPALQLNGSTMRDYALQVALGMRHLEERGITHRDLAARNILVDGAGTLKVADFGLSRSGVYVHTRSRPVPLRWLAPEAILHSQYCSASDVWAFAVASFSNHQVPSFLAGGGRLPKPARASTRLYQLMVDCWSEEPDDRPTFAQIVDKLTSQNQLYVDLDCVLPPAEDDVTALSDYDFSISEISFDNTHTSPIVLISNVTGNKPWMEWKKSAMKVLNKYTTDQTRIV